MGKYLKRVVIINDSTTKKTDIERKSDKNKDVSPDVSPYESYVPHLLY